MKTIRNLVAPMVALAGAMWLPPAIGQGLSQGPGGPPGPALLNAVPSAGPSTSPQPPASQPQVNNSPPRVDMPTVPGFSSTALPTDVNRLGNPELRAAVPLATLSVNPGVFLFSMHGCHGIGDRAGRFALRALRGSLYSVEGESKIKLARGRLLVTTEKAGVTVEAGAAAVVVEPGSSAIVETSPSGLTRVYSLVAYEREHAAVKVTSAAPDSNKEVSLELSPGQEAVIADHDLSEEELISVDGIERRPLEGSVTGSLPGNVRKFEFSLAQMADYDVLINCRQLNGSVPTLASRQLKSVYEHTLAEAARQSGFSPEPARSVSIAPNRLSDPALHAETASAVKEGSSQARLVVVTSGKGCFVAAERTSVFALPEPGKLRLESGSVLVHSKKALLVEARGRQVVVGSGAVALIRVNGTTLKVVDLGDFRNNSVRVAVGKRVINLMPGNEIILSEEAPSLSDVFDVHKLGHRAIVSRNHEEIGWLTSSEIALADFLSQHPLVAGVRTSRSDAAAQVAIARVKKTAAVVAVLRRSADAYERGEPEDETGGTMRIAARCNGCLR